MAFSNAFTQGVSIVVYIAVKMNYERNEGLLATRYIAEKLRIPLPTANKVIRSLVSSGLVVSKEGAKGGLALAENADRITLLDILSAVERDRPLFRKVGPFAVSGPEVDFYVNRIDAALSAAEDGMKERLRGITIADLIRAEA